MSLSKERGQCPCGEELSAYLDGELSRADQKRIAFHLLDCPRCQAEVASLQAATRILRGIPEASVAQPILAPESKPQSSRWQQYLVAALVALVLTLSFLLIPKEPIGEKPLQVHKEIPLDLETLELIQIHREYEKQGELIEEAKTLTAAQ